jgi:CRP-like cAMP-binding protein
MVRVSAFTEGEQAAVREASVIRAMTEERWRALLGRCCHRIYEAGEAIAPPGGNGGAIIVVAAGAVTESMLSADGRELELQIWPAGSVLLWEEDELWPGVSVFTAGEDGTVVYAFVADDVIDGLQSNSQAGVELVALLRRGHTRLRRALAEQTFLSIRARLALLLLDGRPRSGSQVLYTRDELARVLGTTREPATRALAELRDERLVSYPPRAAEITILDPDGLRDLASS